MPAINLNSENLQDAVYLFTGLYKPVNKFMAQADYKSVLNELTLNNNSTIWTLPVTLDVTEDEYKKAFNSNEIKLKYRNKYVGYIEVSDCFVVDQKSDVIQIFNTNDLRHPGVKKELSRSAFRIGGKVFIENEKILAMSINPEKTKSIFSNNNWDTIVGFQTRNPIHRAHEYLQRLGLEICDGLFINPSIGWKKEGDFSVEAIEVAYNTMIVEFYPKDRVYFEGYKAYFRYAGPREAIFHALIRKNLGCTHFIIGRDHAGVGGYYEPYAAHNLVNLLEKNNSLGIKLLLVKEPYFCIKCDQIVTEVHCNHKENNIVKISGTKIREMLKNGLIPDDKYMRSEIAKELIKLKDNLFIKE